MSNSDEDKYSSSVVKFGLPLLALCLLGALVLALTGGGDENGTSTQTSVKDLKYCPICHLELPKQARETGECPRCKLKELKDAHEQNANANVQPKSRVSRWIALVLVLFSVLLSLTYATILFVRHKKTVIAEAEFLHCRCKQCKRRIRFPKHLEGKRGTCPTCRNSVVFESIEARQ